MNFKPAKGVLYFLAFILMSLALICQPTRGVTHVFYHDPGAGYILGTLFAVGAFANLYIGIAKESWNVIWFTPFIIYTVMAWMLVLDPTSDIPLTTAISNTMLIGMIVFELLEDRQVWSSLYR